MDYFFYDRTYFIFILPALIISMMAQLQVQSAFQKYSQMPNHRNLTGAEAARQVLRFHEITNVPIQPISGQLTDHYDPRNNSISLSQPVYGMTTISAVGVAAHEAGHAVQYAHGYVPIKLRALLVPAVNYSSRLAIPLILVGLFLPLQFEAVIYAGIALYSMAVLFSLLTLPVEFNASARAISALERSGMLTEEELQGASKVLRAAAMTYVAAAFASILSLLRLLAIAGNRRR
ncbi:zinc metallopeptidase [Faecalispora anaeroviscerum]|uniref:zinc metallopeptidase n=1 Tax=Faecalispora anaeroviscerum TaxID=2991836 RepID=UPI0024B9CA44|nr:zinc metallopeptidase [Faecalispora anaeroviscerum]